MEHLVERYYKLDKFFLSFCGLWPYQNVQNARLMRVVSTLVILWFLFIQLSSTFTNEITVEYMTDLIPGVLPTFGVLCHFYSRILHEDKLKELFNRMWNDWSLQKTENEIKIMHEHADNMKLSMLCFISLAYIIVLVYSVWMFSSDILDAILPMNESRSRKIGFKIELFINEEKYSYFIRSQLCIGGFLVPAVMIASFTLFMIFTTHACGMCELLGYRAERLFYIENAKGCHLMNKINYRKNIAAFVQLHYDIIKFIGIIENAHTLLFLMDLSGIVVSLSFTLTRILIISGYNFEQLFRSIALLVAQLFYVFWYNYMGHKITSTSSSIYDKMYNSPWYNVPVKEQKELLIIIKRRCQPLVLTAYKLHVLSIQNFGMVFQATISYCMFIRQI